MADGFVDLTEPEPLTVVEGIQNPYDEPYLWRVELYLMAKWAPESVEATIFKVRSAALERAKIVKEHHSVFMSLDDLRRELENDLEKHVQWSPPHSLHKRYELKESPKPGIGSSYQRNIS
jgi:hypothetical protein